MKKEKEPVVGLAHGTPKNRFTAYIPEDIFQSMRRGALQESLNLSRKVTENEFVVRAIIDRVGKTFGTRYASKLYRQYFNGVGALRSVESELPQVINTEIQFFNE
jgi:hypothetical protein